MQLNEFQKQFKDLMLDHPDALLTPPEEIAAFCMEGDIPLPERLKVYRNNIVGSLSEVMLATFPILEKLVGKEFLEGMARSFILQNPPSGGCLSLYGEGFPEFIEGFEHAKPLPYLPDVARLELAMNKAHFAADDKPLTAEAIAAIAPDELGDTRFNTRDSVHLITSPYPLNAIREFCLSGAGGDAPDMEQGGAPLMIYRPQFETEIVMLGTDEYLMLQKLQDGKALGEALEHVINTHQEFDFQAFLQKHLTLETFSALRANI